MSSEPREINVKTCLHYKTSGYRFVAFELR